MVNRRNLLKKVGIATGIGSVTSMTATAQSPDSPESCYQVLEETDEYRIVKSTCGGEEVVLKIYKDSGKTLHVTDYDETVSTASSSGSVGINNSRPVINKSQARLRKYSGECSAINNFDDHYFFAMDFDLTDYGASLGAAVIFGTFICPRLGGKIGAAACAAGAFIINDAFVKASPNFTIGILDRDPGFVYLDYWDDFRYEYLESAQMVAGVYPEYGASKEKISLAGTITDLVTDVRLTAPIHSEDYYEGMREIVRLL